MGGGGGGHEHATAYQFNGYRNGYDPAISVSEQTLDFFAGY